MRLCQFTEEQRCFIVDNYKSMPSHQMAEILKVSLNSLHHFTSRNHIYKHDINADKDAYLCKYYALKSAKQLSLELDWPVKYVYARARTMGLKKK